MDPSLKVRRLPVEQMARWGKNASGPMEVFTDEREKAIGFKVKFPPSVDQWIYPEFRVKQPAESMKGAVGLGFEIKASQMVGGMIMICLDDTHERGDSCWLPYVPTTEWQTVNILFEEDAPADFDPGDIRMFRLGANPGDREFEYRIRNFKIYYVQ
jgi:hypothetical protein